ncbi:hypothetical protein PU13_26205, partial [Escherichia coli]
MSVKPRNFDKNVENQLLKQGVCTQEILSKYSEKEKKFFFNRKRLARTVLIFTESSDQLSRAT